MSEHEGFFNSKKHAATINRRGVIKGAAGILTVVGGAIALKSVTSTQTNQDDKEAQAFLARTPTPTHIPAVSDLPQKNIAVIDQPTPAVSKPSPTPETGAQVPKREYIDVFFSNKTAAQKEVIAALVGEQIAHYRKEPQIEGRIIETLLWKTMVKQAIESLHLSTVVDPDIMESLIYVESGGDPRQKTDYAKGLCQVSPAAVADINNKKKFSPPLNIDNTMDNIKLSALYMASLQDSYPEQSLALWAYHLGQKNMNLAIKTYCMEELDMKPDVVDKTISTYDFQKQQTGTAKLIEQFKNTPKRLNFINLIRSQHVVDALKESDAFHNNTKDYVPRIAAAFVLLEDFEKLHEDDKNLPVALRIQLGQKVAG